MIVELLIYIAGVVIGFWVVLSLGHVADIVHDSTRYLIKYNLKPRWYKILYLDREIERQNTSNYSVGDTVQTKTLDMLYQEGWTNHGMLRDPIEGTLSISPSEAGRSYKVLEVYPHSLKVQSKFMDETFIPICTLVGEKKEFGCICGRFMGPL